MRQKNEKQFSSLAGLILIFVFIGLLGFLLYYPALYGDFVSDDYSFVVNNPASKDLTNLRRIWNSFPTRFLVMLSFALNFFIGALQPFGYHLVNLLLHFGNAFLVYCLILTLCRSGTPHESAGGIHAQPIAVFAALIFLCHPVQTQAVSFISQRTTLLGTLFYLATLVLYIAARKKGDRGLYLAAIATMSLGILSKEMIVTLPATILSYEIFFVSSWGENRAKLIHRLAPFFLLAAFVPLLITQESSQTLFKLRGQLTAGFFSWEYFLTELNVLRTYLRLFLLPVNQNHVYDYPLAKTVFEPMTLYSILLHGGLISGAVIFFKRNRLLSFAVLWFYLTSSIEALTVTYVHREVIFENWLYLPMVGLSLGASVFLFRLNRYSQKAYLFLFGVIVLTLMTLTFQRNHIWRNEITFWEDVVKKSPKKPTAYLGLGSAYLRRGLDEKARETLGQGLARYGGDIRNPSAMDKKFLASVYNNLGTICGKRGDFVKALEYFRGVVSYQPDYGPAYHNLGIAFFNLRQYSQASVAFERSLQLQGEYIDGNYYLAANYLAQGDFAKAKNFAQKALLQAQREKDAQRAKDAEGILTLIQKK